MPGDSLMDVLLDLRYQTLPSYRTTYYTSRMSLCDGCKGALVCAPDLFASWSILYISYFFSDLPWILLTLAYLSLKLL